MKRIISNIKYTATALCAVACMSSCEDFLSTVPLNEIVLENFWENEDEVTSVVASCYSGMTDNNFLTRIMLWGEMRSDNMSKGLINPETPFVNDVQLPEMLDGNILPNYYIADWSSFYRVIMDCTGYSGADFMNHSVNYLIKTMDEYMGDEQYAYKIIALIDSISSWKYTPYQEVDYTDYQELCDYITRMHMKKY